MAHIGQEKKARIAVALKAIVPTLRKTKEVTFDEKRHRLLERAGGSMNMPHTASNFTPRTIRDDVTAYCQQLGLTQIQTDACIDIARATHSVHEGKLTADRLHDRMRIARYRNSPPRAA